MIQGQEKKRFNIFLIAMGVLVLLILGRYAWLMLGPKPLTNPLESTVVNLERGSILDRQGRLLAIQTQLYSVTAWLPQVENPHESAVILSQILERDTGELEKELSDQDGPGFLYVERKITPAQSEAIKDAQEQGYLKGIFLAPEAGRSYPEKNLVSHITGFVGTDNVGLDGLEYTFNQVLAPPVTTDISTPVYGNDIYLTIDNNTQFLVREIARNAFNTHKPDSIMIMVMDAKNGDILSWVSLPDFDPNNFNNYGPEALANNPAVFTYEPGSVFKIFSIASILELRGIHPDDMFDTSQGYNPEVFRDYDIPPITDLHNYGVIDVEHILIHSSNVGSAFASETVEEDEFYQKLRDFGFGKRIGIPLPGESNGILSSPDYWSVRSKPTIAIGQEIGVSAIQMISAATVFTNGGMLLKPHIVKKIVSRNGEVLKEYDREPVRQVVSPSVAAKMLLMMEQVVSDPSGTVRRAQVPGLRISAKSGTAQVADPETGLYSEEQYVASVLGIFPTENPQLIVYVVFETPKGDSYYGGRIAAPVLKEIIETLAPYYNIPIAGNTVIQHSGNVRFEPPVPLLPGDTVPDFIGLSKREAMTFFQNQTVLFHMEGQGHIYRQDPPAGTAITDGMIINLWLR